MNKSNILIELVEARFEFDRDLWRLLNYFYNWAEELEMSGEEIKETLELLCEKQHGTD